jgi:hypothetical protein
MLPVKISEVAPGETPAAPLGHRRVADRLGVGAVATRLSSAV